MKSGHILKPVIHDGDHGSDDFIATLLFAARPDLFDLLGVTTGFGNTNVGNAAHNALAALHLAKRPAVPVYKGSERPLIIPPKTGDNTFEENGLAGVHLSCGDREPESMDAIEWMAEIILRSQHPVTLCLTGLMTNAARLFQLYPETKHKIESIVAMGGCQGPLTRDGRCGNITPFAEFNFFMDPDAAHFVLNCGVPVVLLALDATHHVVFTPERQKILSGNLPDIPGRDLIHMMRAAEKYDFPVFGLNGAVVHDPNVPLYLIAPDYYEGHSVSAQINIDSTSASHGQLHVKPDCQGSVLLINKIKNPDALFNLMCDILGSIFNS